MPRAMELLATAFDLPEFGQSAADGVALIGELARYGPTSRSGMFNARRGRFPLSRDMLCGTCRAAFIARGARRLLPHTPGSPL